MKQKIKIVGTIFLVLLLLQGCSDGNKTDNYVNTIPIADAGEDQSSVVGEVVQLDGLGSSDANGDQLTFSWSLTKPEGSSAEILNPLSEKVSFTPDVPGIYTVSLIVNDGFANSDSDSTIINVIFVDNRKAVIPIDTNIDFGLEPGILYYADPQEKENGLNRALRIDYKAMDFTEVEVFGLNPHSIDRAGKTNRFYMRTQNDYAFDVVDFKKDSTKTIPLGIEGGDDKKRKPRAIGAYNDKYKIQLLSAKNMPTIDIIDVETDTILAIVGDQNNSYAVGSNAGEDGTGHALWFDEDHFGILDRVSNSIRLYRVSKNTDNTLSFAHVQDFPTRKAVHGIERVENATTKEDSLTFYAMVDGDVNDGTAPSVLEIIFNPNSKELREGKEVVFKDSVEKVSIIKPTTHHSGISADGKYLIVPILTGKVYFIDRKKMRIEKVVEAKLGAAHVNVSKEENVIVITNHFSHELTFIDAESLEVKKHLEISHHAFDPDNKHLLQPHFSYIGPEGRYYYTFATQDGMFLKIDLRTLEIVEQLFTDGAPEQAHS